MEGGATLSFLFFSFFLFFSLFLLVFGCLVKMSSSERGVPADAE